MSQLKKSKPVKLIMSIIFKEEEVLECVMRDFNRAFGQTDFVSEIFPFDFTDYYCKEMGNPLKRQFITFLKLIAPEMLPKIKFETNRIELKYTRDGSRQANIDPGYISAERLVLATGKNFTHRIYLNDGVYADLTLIYQNKDFRPLPWTYPDYASPKIKEIFKQIREKYLLQSHLTFDNNDKL